VTRRFTDPPERFFEDFELGDVIVTRGRTVDASDLIAFAGLTGDYYPLHVDAEFAARTRFGARIAHGPLTQSIAVGLVGMTGYYGDGIVALIEVRSLRALLPVFAGDTLHVRAEVTAHEEGESPRFGQLEVTYSVRNQKEEEVMVFEQVMLARRRPDDGGEDA
jgi:3-hydroxybutyryl-CoA dehydratase